eukprot:SAG31_NODE_2032_length_6625_cov_3.010113_3_plen_129_part_00
MAACERRERAVSLGILEGIFAALSLDCGGPLQQATPGLLGAALRGLQRIGLGYDDKAVRRNERAQRAGLVPVVVQLLDRHRVQNPAAFRMLALQGLGVFHEQMKLSEATWESEISKFPELGPAFIGLG